MYTISDEIVATLRHILDTRIDHCSSENYVAWTSARDIVEYALAENMECLKEYDYYCPVTCEDFKISY